MSDLQGRVISSLRWQALAKVGSQVVSWGSTIFVMRLLTPADYGLMAMVMILVGLAALIAEMGLGAAIVQAAKVDVEQQRAVFGLSVLVNIGLYLCLLAAAPLAAAMFKEPRLVLLIAVMGLQFPLGALAVVPDAMARRDLRFKALGLIELVIQLGTAAVTFAGALLGWGVWALIAGHLATTLIRVVLLTGYFKPVAPSFKLRGQGALLRFGGSLTANRLVWFAYSQADVFIAGKLLGPQLLGAYSVAVNLANMPMQKMMAISNQVAFSAFAKLQADKAAFALGIQNTLRLSLTVSIGLLWGLAATAPVLVPLLLGDKWSDAIVPLQVIAAMVPLRIASATLSTACIAAGHVGMDLKNNITGMLLLAPAFTLGALYGGIIGLAAAWLLMYPVFFVITVVRIASRLEMSIAELLRPLARPGLAGVSMAACILLLQQGLASLPGLPLLGVECAAGAAAFVLAVRLLDPGTLVEVRRFVQPSYKG